MAMSLENPHACCFLGKASRFWTCVDHAEGKPRTLRVHSMARHLLFYEEEKNLLDVRREEGVSSLMAAIGWTMTFKFSSPAFLGAVAARIKK